MNWREVLPKINDKIQGNVLSVTHLRNTMSVQRFKALLKMSRKFMSKLMQFWQQNLKSGLLLKCIS